MRMKRVAAVLLSFCLAIAAIGCGNESEQTGENNGNQGSQNGEANNEEPENQEEIDPFGGYEEPITLTTIVPQTLTQAVPEGVTLEDNPWQDLWKSKGIHVEYTAVAADMDDLQSKINMAIVSEEIPDYMSVSYTTYKELLEADMIYDLTDVFEQYATEEVKELMYADGGLMAEEVTEDGRLYGIVQPADYYDQGAVVAIRTDWMEELGMEPPTNLTELWDLAKAFKDNNMDGTCTIGIGATKEISALLPMKYLISAHGGKSSTWVEKDGALEYGLIQPEMKEALSQIHDKYVEGLLDQEYGTKNEQQLFEDAVSGKSGIVITNMTAPFYTDNGIDLGQEWGYFPLYTADGSFAQTEVSVSPGAVIVVSKECENPEAVIKLFNMTVKYGVEEPVTYSQDGLNNLTYPATLVEVGKNIANYEAYTTYLETGETPEDVPSDYEGTAASCELWRVDGDKEGRTLYNIFGPGGTQSVLAQELEGGGYYIDPFSGAAGEASTKYSGNLGTLATQMMTNIITGAVEVDYFDEFVEIWKSSGGDEITKEVNEWYQENK